MLKDIIIEYLKNNVISDFITVILVIIGYMIAKQKIEDVKKRNINIQISRNDLELQMLSYIREILQDLNTLSVYVNYKDNFSKSEGQKIRVLNTKHIEEIRQRISYLNDYNVSISKDLE